MQTGLTWKGDEVEFRLLGPMKVTTGGRDVPIPSGKPRILLATLLVHANHSVSTDYLASRLWDIDEPLDTRATIQLYVRRLRKALGDEDGGHIRTRPGGYLLEVHRDQLDLTCFADLMDRAAAAEDEEKEQALLAEALQLWRGPALADVPSERLHLEDLTYLTERLLHARERLTELELGRGRYAEVILNMRELTREHPLRERAWHHLMVALYRSGRRAEALEAYRTVATHLRHELGIDTNPDLRSLHHKILMSDPALDVPRSDRPRCLPVQPRQLPAAVPGFVGREAALRMLSQRMARQAPAAAAIAALTGPAGVGKTALAVHWAWRMADRFPDGQLYVDLRGSARAQKMTANEALAALLRALGTRSYDIPADLEERAALYRSLLAGRSVLVVLDNAATSEQVRPLLPGEPRCCAVITSRDELRGLIVSHGAIMLRLDTLTHADSHELLRELIGGRRVADEPEAVAELATLCGHLPLTLRIAAADLQAMPARRVEHYVARFRDSDLSRQLTIVGDRRS